MGDIKGRDWDKFDAPPADVSARLLKYVFRYELDLDEFFMGSRWEGNPWDGGSVVGCDWCVNVNDTFAYACADAEAITQDNIHIFEAVCDWAAERELEFSAPLLFAIYMRKMLPLPQATKYHFGTDESFKDILDENLG